MNEQTVFSKTSAGEDAIRERVRLVQRNLRTVLILVDGASDVAALKRQAGDGAMVDAALAELESMGLVARRDGSDGRQEPGLRTEDAALPTSGSIEDALTGDRLALELEPRTEETHRAAEGYDGTTDASSFEPEKPLRHLDAEEEDLYERAYGQEDHTQMALVTPRHEGAPQPPRRGGKLKRGQLIAIGVVGALVFAILRVVLYPYDEYRPDFERTLSRVLDDRVRVGNLRVNFLPRPVVVLERVSLGETPHTTIAAIRMTPALTSLLPGETRYDEVRAEGVRLGDASLARMSRWFRSGDADLAGSNRIVVDRLTVESGRVAIANLDGAIDIGARRGIARAVLQGKEGDLRLEIVPAGPGWSIAASASNWEPLARSGVVLTALTARAELLPGRLRLDSFEGRVYDGTFAGKGLLEWGRASDLVLNVEMRKVAAGRLLEALGIPPLLDGAADAALSLSAPAPVVGRLGDEWRVKGAFTVHRGRLRGLDLAGVLRIAGQAGTQPLQGGSTTFEEFSARLVHDRDGVRITAATLASGLLRASGQVSVLPASQSMSGSGTVELNASGSQRRASFAISGKLATPTLKAGRPTAAQ